jgi:TonB family protein
MRDGVADVLAQRAKLDRGAAPGFVVSAALHVVIGGWLAYNAMHATTTKPVGMVNIQFASAPRASAPPAARKPAAPQPVAAPAVPKIEEPKPRIEEPKPVVPEPAKAAEKNTVPLSPFGQSTKKGSETPAPAKAAPAPAAAAGATPGAPAIDVPVGGSGVTGLEGGDFPYTLYITGMHRRIGTNWFRPAVPPGATTVVYFRIQRDGTITDAKTATSSGNGTFDRAALSAVVSSSPLNPLPFGYNGNYLGVHLTFR